MCIYCIILSIKRYKGYTVYVYCDLVVMTLTGPETATNDPQAGCFSLARRVKVGLPVLSMLDPLISKQMEHWLVVSTKMKNMLLNLLTNQPLLNTGKNKRYQHGFKFEFTKPLVGGVHCLDFVVANQLSHYFSASPKNLMVLVPTTDRSAQNY